MKFRKKVLLITFILLSLVFGSTSVQSRLDGITVGDTLKYRVSALDFPLESIFEFGDPEESGFNPDDIILDLKESTVAIKVMDKYPDGYYNLNAYAILGKSVEIPVPNRPNDDEDDTLSEIFGDKIIIPAGVGIALGQYIPGSDMLKQISDDSNYYGGIQFYLDPNEWDTYEEYFKNSFENDSYSSSSSESYETYYVSVIQSNSVFILDVLAEYNYTRFDSEYGYNEHSTSNQVFTWFKTGTSGLLKEVYVSTSMTTEYTGTEYQDNEDRDYSMEIALQYDSKENNPLPAEILNKEDIFLELETATAAYDTSGYLSSDSFTNVLDWVMGNVTAIEGQDIIKFDVKTVKGCYYETEIFTYDPESETLIEQPGSLWWNGFTGMNTYLYDWDESPYDMWGMSLAIIPFSPAITPDWDMWRSTTKSIDSIFSLLVDSITSQSAQDAIGEYGVTIGNLDITSEMRSSGNYKYIYLYGDLDVSFFSNNIDPDLRPENWQAGQELHFILNYEFWVSYNYYGLIAGARSAIDFDFSFVNLLVSEEWDSEEMKWIPTYEDGSLNMNLDLKLVNPDYSELPDASDAKKDVSGNPVLSPSISIIPTVLVLAFVAVIFKRRKK